MDGSALETSTVTAIDLAPDVLEFAQPLGEQRARQARCPVAELVEGTPPLQEIAEDDGRPTLGDDLRTTGERAVLAVCPHRASVPDGWARRSDLVLGGRNVSVQAVTQPTSKGGP